VTIDLVIYEKVEMIGSYVEWWRVEFNVTTQGLGNV
jgi:hypothetical protein